jgi:geranylgeranyl pyrophosphate synthase
MLAMLKEFGLALGMAIQISDDCSDIVDDLTNGIYTLPVIEGLAMSDHLKHPKLQQLLSQPVLQRQDAHQVETVLEQMGAIKTCRRLIRAYQVQVEAVFDVLPGLRPYFADYVASKA